MGRRNATVEKAKSTKVEFPASRRTLPFDRIITGIGRIRVRSGTNNPKLFKTLNEMLNHLAKRPGRQTTILTAIQTGAVAPLRVLEAIRWRQIPELRDEIRAARLEVVPTWEAWAELGVSKSSATERLGALHRLSVHLHGPLSLHLLPKALRAYSMVAKADGTPAMFNRVRHATMAFVRDHVGILSPTYNQLRAVPALKEVQAARPGPTPEQAIQIRDALDPVAGRVWWGQYTTGMGPAEYAGEWVVEDDHVFIAGTKAADRDRTVPKIWVELRRERLHMQTFAKRIRQLREEHGWDLEPYDARRGFKQLLENSRLPGTLVDTYLGHSIKGKVGERYSVRQLELRREADAEAVREVLARAEANVRAGTAPPPRALRKASARRAGTAKSPRKSPQRGKSTGTRKPVKP